jgi:hypothetical protein
LSGDLHALRALGGYRLPVEERNTRWHRIADGDQPIETWLDVEHSQLEMQHQEVKSLGFLVFVYEFRRQCGNLVDQLSNLLRTKLLPRFFLSVTFDESPLRPDDEVVRVHRRNLRPQERCGFISDRLLIVTVGRAGLPYGMSRRDGNQSGFRQPLVQRHK